MSNAKACLVFARGLESKVLEISAQLVEEGFDVCTASADREVVEAAKLGSINVPEDIKACIDNASICIFLISEQNSEHVQAAAGYAGISGKKIIAVIEDVDYLPQVFDELATSVVCVDSPQLPDVLKGKSVWESSNGSADGKRVIPRIRCQ
ncbi:hypothetical protein [Pseudomonas fragi]|uniref:hypothetical protein n=1 Tax=Pseudomonas fragi TaxID=296 RepID=UPI00381AB355